MECEHEWSLPPRADVHELRREEHQWDTVGVLNTGEGSARTVEGSAQPVQPEVRAEDAVFRVAEAWIDSGGCLAREGTLNVNQAAALLLTAHWLQEVMNQRWLGTPGMTPVLRLIVQGGPGTGNTSVIN